MSQKSAFGAFVLYMIEEKKVSEASGENLVEFVGKNRVQVVVGCLMTLLRGVHVVS